MVSRVWRIADSLGKPTGMAIYNHLAFMEHLLYAGTWELWGTQRGTTGDGGCSPGAWPFGRGGRLSSIIVIGNPLGSQ